MTNEFRCECGEIITATDDWLSVSCPRCGKVFKPDSEHEAFGKPEPPIVETAPARFAAWGCIYPVALGLLVFGIANVFLHRSIRADYQLGSGIILLGIFLWILKRNHYSKRTIYVSAAFVAAITGVVGLNICVELWRQKELDTRYAVVLTECTGFPDHKLEPTTKVFKKCLPVRLTPPGAHQRSSTPHVDTDVYALLSDDIRPSNCEEVRTLVVLDWWYELTGHYVSKDAFKKVSADTYRGGCTIKFVDRDTREVVAEETLFANETPPSERSGEDITDWYSPQPTVKDIVECVQKYKFVAK
jgi:hypothetical protein